MYEAPHRTPLRAIFAVLLLATAGTGAAATRTQDVPLDPSDVAAAARLVTTVGDARVVVIEGDDPDRTEVMHRVRTLLLRELHAAGFDLVVYPVGIFEGWWVDRFLAGADPLDGESDLPLYGVWLRSEAFRNQLGAIRSTHRTARPLRVIGGLSRFHARGKELYAPHLLEALAAGGAPLPVTLQQEVVAAWGGRARLARETRDARQAALQVHGDVARHLAEHRDTLVGNLGARRVALEEQFLANMKTFLELERMRGGDIDMPPDFTVRELGANLRWLAAREPAARMIVIAGRGDEAVVPASLGPAARIRIAPQSD